MNKPKRLAAVLLTAVLAVSLAACSSNNNAQTPSQDQPADNGTNTNKGANESNTPVEENPILHVVGSYTGQIDTTSIEVVTEEGPTVFQFGEDFDTAILETLKEEDRVELDYTEKTVEGDSSVKQRFVTKIAKSNAEDPNSGGTSSPRPSTQSFELELEGMKETQTAKLAEGSGYSLYVFDMFTFDAAAGKLYMTAFPDYSAVITPLPADFKLDELRAAAEKKLAETAEVRELKGEEITPSMRDASLFLMANTDKVTKEIIVKEIDGASYQFEVTIPVGEASEGFGPHAFLSLNSIAAK